MADWVHCNQCFIQPGGGRKFSLTNCGHTFCQNCLDADSNQRCGLCGNPCTTIPLTSKMKPEVEKFFCDPADLVKRHQAELAQVMSFQKGHRQRLTSFIRQKMASQTERVNQGERMVHQFKDMDKENQRLKAENAYLKKLIGSMSGNAGRGPVHPIGRVHGGMVLSQRASQNSPSGARSDSGSPYMNSPRSQGSKPQSMETRSSPKVASQGGKRLSIRPPPVEGKFGDVLRTPSPNKSISYSARTPGSAEASLPHIRTCPMATSPSHQTRRTGNTPHVPINGSQKTSVVSMNMFATPPMSHAKASHSQR